MINQFDTIIVSDLHCGSRLLEAKKFLTVIKNIKFKRLILLGDIFSDLNFSRLIGDHWKILSYIRKLSNPKNGVEVIWVYGNHDEDLTEVMSHLVGVEVLDRYVWHYNDKICVALHGHQFDPTLSKWSRLGKVLGWWHLQLQKTPFIYKHLSRWIDSLFSYVQNISEIIKNRAIVYATLHGYNVICCGHTHEALYFLKDNVEYFNSGCWVKNECSFIGFHDGIIEIIKC